MNDILWWIIGAVVALLGGGFLIEKRKATKATKAKEQAEEERDNARMQATIAKAVSHVKDQLATKKAENAVQKEEVVQSIADIPHDKEVELSDETKKLAAEQAARAADRARARAKRL